MKPKVWSGAFLAIAMLAAGCGGGSTTQSIVCPGYPDGICPEATDVAEPDAVTPDGTAPSQKRLEFAATTDDYGQSVVGKQSFGLILYYAEKKELGVIYKEGDKPISGAAITYEIIGDTQQIAHLTAAMAYTDDDGKASVDIQSDKSIDGDFSVKVCADGEPDVPCLTFKVTVTCKGCDEMPLTVGFADYKGQYPFLDTAQVLLFKQKDGKPKCSELKLGALPPATVASKEQAMGTNFIFKQLPGLEADQTQVYSIVGTAKQGKDGPIQAYACDDTNGKVEWKQKRYVELTWQDVWPRVAGPYDIYSTFDLVDGLPPDVQSVVGTVTGFFLNPAAEIMLLFCKASSSSDTLKDFCGYLFTNKDAPKIDELSTTGQVVFDIVNAVLVAILEKYCPFEDKTKCGKIYWAGKDIASIFEKFQVISTLEFPSEPDDSGKVADVKETWHSVRLRWTLGANCPPEDDECGWKKFSFSVIPGIEKTVTGKFDATLTSGKLSIPNHTVTMKYGALVNFAIEQWLLPSIFGNGSDGLPAVDSYEEMIGAMLAGKACLQDESCCETFAQEVSKSASGVTKTLIKSACDALILYGAKYLRDKLTALDTTPDNFSLATKSPCTIEDKNKDMKFDAIGSKTSPCEWDATLKVSGFDYKPVGTFYGNAQ